jgi:hypothetical protein
MPTRYMNGQLAACRICQYGYSLLRPFSISKPFSLANLREIDSVETAMSGRIVQQFRLRLVTIEDTGFD